MQRELIFKTDQSLFNVHKSNQMNKYQQFKIDKVQNNPSSRTAPPIDSMKMSYGGDRLAQIPKIKATNAGIPMVNPGPLIPQNKFSMITPAPNATTRFVPRAARPPMMSMTSGFRSIQSSSLHGAAMASRATKRMTPAPSSRFSRTSTVLQAQAAAADQGMIPDMEKRNLMNLILLSSIGATVASLGGPFLYYFYPSISGGSGGALPALDANGDVVTLTSWKANHKPEDRQLVQGLKGDAHYLITTESGVKDYGINAVCTHLGCVVPWNKAENKFMCPCHGSQYNDEGKVIRGPAPLSLAIAHVNIDNDKVVFTPWTETDFRTGNDPWWK